MSDIIANGNLTQLAGEALDQTVVDYLEDSEISVLNARDYFKNHDGSAQFAEGIQIYAKKAGFDNSKSLLKFLQEDCYLAHGIKPMSEPTLRKWISGANSPNQGEQGHRYNVYKLCFALGLDGPNTKIFFLKHYLDRPCNYKDVKEACYYFCLKNGLTFQEAEKMIADIEQNGTYNDGDEKSTVQIGADIDAMNSEEIFLEYMKSRATATNYNSSAITKIQELLAASKKFFRASDKSSADFADVNSSIKKSSIISDVELLEAIYGINMEDSSKILNSDLPDKIKDNILTPMQLSNIQNGKATSLTIRKALILLQFYSYYTERDKNYGPVSQEDVDRDFEGFVSQLDSILATCGYLQHYWRNPFDWMIGFAAKTASPVATFQELIESYIDDN